MAIKFYTGNTPGFLGDWSHPGNWIPAGVPVTGDDVFIVPQYAKEDIVAGLNQSTIQLRELHLTLPENNVSIGTNSSYLEIGCDRIFIGSPESSTTVGSFDRIRLNISPVKTDIIIYNGPTTTINNRPPIDIIHSNLASSITVHAGYVGIAYDDDQLSQFNSCAVYGGNVHIGRQCRLSLLYQTGGVCYVEDEVVSAPYKNALEAYISGGLLTSFGRVQFQTLQLIASSDSSATWIRNSTGNVTNLEIGMNGFFDGRFDRRLLSITNTKLYAGASLDLRNGVVGSYSFVNKPVLVGCGRQHVTVRTEPNDPNYV